ncbi:MAG: hypothetical protein GY702_06860 [Desulfobulbaceae bacterium]|nr:hypothetical protein [Desulfobulbaceae bacterium]
MIKRNISIFLCLPALLLLSLFTLSCQKSYSENEISGAIEKGNMLVERIEAYYQKEGRYPLYLEDLVPKYIPNIPKTGINPGKEELEFYYHYVSGGKAKYELFFFVEDLTLGTKTAKRCTYNSTGKYPSSESVKTERMIKNWAIQTQYRNYWKK